MIVMQSPGHFDLWWRWLHAVGSAVPHHAALVCLVVRLGCVAHDQAVARVLAAAGVGVDVEGE